MAAKPITDEDHSRLISLIEGTLSDAEFQKLEIDLRERPELRETWIRLQDQEMALEQRSYRKAPGTEARRYPWIAIAAIFSASLLLLSLLTKNGRESKSSFSAVALPGQEEVAIVISSVGVVTDEKSSGALAPGAFLKPGTIKLAGGELELVFISGASLSLQGNSEIHIISENLVYLKRGKAAARVPEEAIGFTLKTPDAAVVDLGTEFIAEVGEDRKSLVHVYDGEVHVSLLGEDGSTLSGARVTSGDAVVVSPETRDLTATKVENPDALPRVPEQDYSLLNIPPAYRKKISRAKPLVHWTFDDFPDGDFTSTGPLKAMHSAGNGAVYFQASPDGPQFIQSEEHVAGINQGNYTMELWVKPDRFHYATLFGLFIESKDLAKAQPVHLNVVEFMHKSHLIHRANSIRFLHRWPPGMDRGKSEVNAFSDTPFLPMRWQHIVAVKRDASISLYINSKHARTISKKMETHAAEYRIVLGQIDSQRELRQFNGLLDEFALYSRALSPEEIATHYRLLKEANPDQLSYQP